MNNSESNLEVVCSECNLVLHCGLAGLQNKIKIFESAELSQVEIIKKTRELRSKGLTDNEIIKELGLTKVDTDAVRIANQLLTGKKPNRHLIGFIVKTNSN